MWWLYIVRVDNYERGESELKGEPSRCDDDGNDDDCDDLFDDAGDYDDDSDYDDDYDERTLVYIW